MDKVTEWRIPIYFPGTIVDVETTSEDPSSGELITFGYFCSGCARVFMRTGTDDVSGKKFRRLVQEALKHFPHPYYAYNSEFEQKLLRIKIEHDLFKKWKRAAHRLRKCEKDGWVKVSNDKSVCPKCGRELGKSFKWPKLSELVSLPHAYYKRDVEAKNSTIPKLWKKYVKSRDEKFLRRIISHNFYDLIRSACLLLWDETILDTLAIVYERRKHTVSSLQK